MTRQHFNAIANVLRQQMDAARYTDKILTPALSGEENLNGTSSEIFRIKSTAEALADQFEVINPRFKRDYFLAVALGETE